jgi:hypothetical protein
MQKLLFPLALVALSLSACAQNAHLDKFYHKYQSSSGNSINFNFSSDNASSLLNANFSGNSHTSNEWIHKITGLRLLMLDDKNTGAGQEWTDLEEALRQDRYEELITVRKGKDRLRLLSKDGAGGIKELAFLVAGKDGGGLFFYFRGAFTEKDLTSIQSSLQDNDSQ